MLKLIRYNLRLILRWGIYYTLFYGLLAYGLLSLNANPVGSLATLLNVVIYSSPMAALFLAIVFYFNSHELSLSFMVLPLSRKQVFFSQYLALNLVLGVGVILGLGFPFLLHGFTGALGLLMVLALLLNACFSAIGYALCLKQENKLKVFGLGFAIWVTVSLLYDGLLMGLLIYLSSYPTEGLTILATLVNPIDLSRTLMLMVMEATAFMGYTGAVFQRFFTDSLGMVLAVVALIGWVVLPLALFNRWLKKKSF